MVYFLVMGFYVYPTVRVYASLKGYTQPSLIGCTPGTGASDMVCIKVKGTSMIHLFHYPWTLSMSTLHYARYPVSLALRISSTTTSLRTRAWWMNIARHVAVFLIDGFEQHTGINHELQTNQRHARHVSLRVKCCNAVELLQIVFPRHEERRHITACRHPMLICCKVLVSVACSSLLLL